MRVCGSHARTVHGCFQCCARGRRIDNHPASKESCRSIGSGSGEVKMRRQRAKRKGQRADQALAWPKAEMRRAVCPLVFAILALCPLWFISSTSSKGLEMPVQERARIRAPELSGGRGWLNTDKPLSLAALKGKVVLLDFWTYGCINCMHIIPDLKRLEKKYPNELVVIGVHSAKFENEKDTENIRRIILRYEIEHPIVNDADFNIWRAYAVDAWPTRYLIDPAGYVIGRLSGEGGYEALDKAIGESIAEFRKRGELNEAPLKLVLEKAKVGDLPLAFPGKVIADEKSDRLFIADSDHNRIVIAKLDGTLVDVIGTGAHGMVSGSFSESSFS